MSRPVGAVNQGKFDKKAKANEKIEKFDTSPLELTVGLQVVMRDTVSKRQDIPATVVSLQPGGRSAYMKTEGSNRTYLRNHRLLRVDTARQVTEATTYVVTCLEHPPGHAS